MEEESHSSVLVYRSVDDVVVDFDDHKMLLQVHCGWVWGRGCNVCGCLSTKTLNVVALRATPRQRLGQADTC